MSDQEIGVDTAQAEPEVIDQIDQKEESAASEKDESTQEANPETDADSDDESSDESARKTPADKRISQLTWKFREQERRADALERELREIRQQSAPKSEAIEYPTLESVGYDEAKFRQAVDDYYAKTIDTRLSDSLQKQRRATEEETRTKEQQQRSSQFFSKGVELADDFYDVVTDENVMVTDVMADTLMSIEKGPELLYHLAKNPSEAARIADLSPYQQAVEIGRLEARMSFPKPKKTSSAPDPIKPVRAGGESVSKDPDQMSMKEYVAWRERQRKGN